MHAPRRRIPTSRRTAFRNRRRYSVCGLARNPQKKQTAGGFPSTVAMCVALAICAIAMVRFSPVVPPIDPAKGQIISHYTIDDFANQMR